MAIPQTSIKVYMSGYDKCRVEVVDREVADVLITAMMDHDPKLAAMVFLGVAKYMKIHNMPPNKMEEFLALL
jgi:hypothetical protein